MTSETGLEPKVLCADVIARTPPSASRLPAQTVWLLETVVMSVSDREGVARESVV